MERVERNVTMAPGWKIGALVQLKSDLTRRYGVTVMTIESVRRNGRVICVWFDDKRTLFRAAFNADALAPWKT